MMRRELAVGGANRVVVFRRPRMVQRRWVFTRDVAEVAKFAGIDWQDETGLGGAAPLHAMNPVRVQYVCERVDVPGKRVVDVGCGGGLLSVSLAEAGAQVAGVDASAASIAAARARAEKAGVEIELIEGGPEDVDATFDVVCAMEVVEHAADAEAFVDELCRLCKPGGSVFLSTMDRNLVSWALGIVAAEHLLRLLPAGTHDWRKFQAPSSLAALFGARGLHLADVSALYYFRGPAGIQRAWLGDYLPGRTSNYILHAINKNSPSSPPSPPP